MPAEITRREFGARFYGPHPAPNKRLAVISDNLSRTRIDISIEHPGVEFIAPDAGSYRDEDSSVDFLIITRASQLRGIRIEDYEFAPSERMRGAQREEARMIAEARLTR